MVWWLLSSLLQQCSDQESAQCSHIPHPKEKVTWICGEAAEFDVAGPPGSLRAWMFKERVSRSMPTSCGAYLAKWLLRERQIFVSSKETQHITIIPPSNYDEITILSPLVQPHQATPPNTAKFAGPGKWICKRELFLQHGCAPYISVGVLTTQLILNPNYIQLQFIQNTLKFTLKLRIDLGDIC